MRWLSKAQQFFLDLSSCPNEVDVGLANIVTKNILIYFSDVRKSYQFIRINFSNIYNEREYILSIFV